MNALLKETVGIVSKKPQTTRQRVLGIYTDDEAQIIFMDAPGKVHAESGINSFLEKELNEEVCKQIDAIICIGTSYDFRAILGKFITQ